MADPKSKAVNGNQTSEKTIEGSKVKLNGNSTPFTPASSPPSQPVSPSEKNGKQTKLAHMLSLLQEVAKDAEGLADYENVAEVRRSLVHKEGEVQKLRDFNKDLMRQVSECKAEYANQVKTLLSAFEQRYKVFDSNNTAVETMQAEVTEVKVKLEAAKVEAKNKQAELEKLAQKLKKADENVTNFTKEVHELNAESELQRSRLETGAIELAACRSKLAAARADLGDDLLHEYDQDGLRKLGLDLQALSRKCHSLALEFFNDPDGAKDSVTEIAELNARFPEIPLSTASTKAAAKLRCAAAEAVIADILATHIFTPFYLSPDAKAAATTLLDFFGDDERRRAVYRCQVLLSHQARGEEAARIEEDIVRRASNEVRTQLSSLVSVEKQAGFYASNAVPGLFRDALKLWSEVQRAREPIIAEKPDLTEGVPPGKYDEYDAAPIVSPRSPKGTPANAGGSAIPKGSRLAAVLFPQVVTREDIIFNGVVLWTNQTEAPAAAAQPQAPAVAKNTSVNTKSTPPIVGSSEGGGGGGGRRHQRRRSVVGEEGAAFKSKQNGHGLHANGGASVAVNGN